MSKNNEDIEIDFKEFFKQIKNYYKNMDIRDYVILILLLLMSILVWIYNRDIALCNKYWTEIINNTSPFNYLIP